MERAEQLKADGVQFFSSGKLEEAAAKFYEAVEVVKPLLPLAVRTRMADASDVVSGDPKKIVNGGGSSSSSGSAGENTGSAESDREVPEVKLMVALWSNLSLVFMQQRNYAKCVVAAQTAVQIDPLAIKAWLRLVKARFLDGFAFDAFLILLRHVRPLVRRAIAFDSGKKPPLLSIPSKEAASLLEEIEVDVHKAVRLENVLQSLELEDYGGGVRTVCHAKLPPNRVLLIESRLETGMDGLGSEMQTSASAEGLLSNFVDTLLSYKKKSRSLIAEFRKEMTGAWPRHADDVPPTTLRKVSDFLRAKNKMVGSEALSSEDFDEVVFLALKARYNCFHSGFFRTCALANHSCEANIAMKYNPQTQTVTLITVRDIEPGDVLSVKYLSDSRFMVGVGKRREYLHHSWLFWCVCPRCIADMDPSATTEHVRCVSCREFIHMPIPGQPDEKSSVSGDETDPQVTGAAVCPHCQHSNQWPTEAENPYMQQMARWEVNDANGIQQLSSWFIKAWETLGDRMHRNHWLNRVLLYFYCVPITGVVQRHYDDLRNQGPLPPNSVATTNGLLGAFGFLPSFTSRFGSDATAQAHTDSSHELAADGGDVLAAILELWRLISPFYPPYEAWAIHNAVMLLVLVSLLNASHPNALNGSRALGLIAFHGKYLTNNECHQWISTYKIRKQNASDSKTKQPTLKQLRAALNV